MDDPIAIIWQHAEEVMTRPGSHGFDHVRRVVRLCEVIGREENADMRVLLPAALFHDIGREAEERDGIPHEEAGAEEAERFLRSAGYDEDLIPAICHAIRTHRFSTGPEPGTPEAKILSDADKLDAMGATGIARTFLRAGEHRGEIRDGVDHMHAKLLHLTGLMHTVTARRLAGDRHRFLCLFLKTLSRETALPDPTGDLREHDRSRH
jgi:uncharacterized protein